MTNVDMTNYLFESSTFEFDEEPSATPPGRDAAEFLRSSFVQANLSAEPVLKSTEGWEFTVTMNGRRYGIFVTWAPRLGVPPCYWVVQVRAGGFFRSLLNIRDTSGFAEFMETVLRQKHEIQNGRWVTDTELQSYY